MSALAISKRMFSLLNAQGNREIEASLQYLSMAMWFNKNNLNGSEKWCLKHSEEERAHGLKIFDHLSNRRIYESKGEGERHPILKFIYRMPPTPLEDEPEKLGGAKDFQFSERPNVSICLNQSYEAVFKDPVQLWQTAMKQEQEFMGYFREILVQAREEKDYVTETLLLNFYIPEQFEEEKAVEEILENAMLVTKRGPGLYYELDRHMPAKPH